MICLRSQSQLLTVNWRGLWQSDWKLSLWPRAVWTPTKASCLPLPGLVSRLEARSLWPSRFHGTMCVRHTGWWPPPVAAWVFAAITAAVLRHLSCFNVSELGACLTLDAPPSCCLSGAAWLAGMARVGAGFVAALFNAIASAVPCAQRQCYRGQITATEIGVREIPFPSEGQKRSREIWIRY